MSAIRVKLTGARNLHRLISGQPDALFLAFSSVNGFFGGRSAGAYAAGNSALDAYCRSLREGGAARVYCYAWSLWDEVGITRDYQMKSLAEARGYRAISAHQGLASLIAALDRNLSGLLVGVDGDNAYVRPRVRAPARPLVALGGYYSAGTKPVGSAELERLVVRDRFGSRLSCRFQRLSQLPTVGQGEIDRQALTNRRVGSAYIAPRNEMEEVVANIWREVLHRDRVGVHDNFFELGGDSLTATQVLSRLRVSAQVDTPLGAMFEKPTVEGLAVKVLQQRAATVDQAALEQLLAQIERSA